MAGPTATDNRQIVQRAALPMIGSSPNASLDTIFPAIDTELAKLFQDRNVILADGGTITWTGTLLSFSEGLTLTIEQSINTAVAPKVITFSSSNQLFSNNGDVLYATINRIGGTGTLGVTTPSTGSYIPPVAAANQEIYVIAIRRDAADGTQRLYFRNGAAFNAGQTARLGSAGSGGSGSGIGDDLDSLQFQASFSDLFTESYTNANTSINSTGTNAVFNAAKSMYAISYDASKTVTTSGTTATLSGAPAFTVAIGDIVISGNNSRKITAVASQTSYTLEAAFPTALTAAACNVSQTVYTKDIYNLSIDGVPLANEFGTATFSEIMVDYKDNATAGVNTFNPAVGPFVAYTASNDQTNYTAVNTRVAIGSQVTSTFLPSAGTSLYLRFFANATSGSGTVNLVTYKAFMQKALSSASGGTINASIAYLNGAGTPVNCTLSVVGGKTVVSLPYSYAVGVNSNTGTGGRPLPYGSLDVYINGQMIPRFVDSTTTADAYYTESSPKSITLDKDYSSYNLSVEVLQRVAVVDSSTQNTSNISNLQEIATQGFNSFVNTQNIRTATSTVGTPAAGTFYSTIVNRANIVDISQDLRVSFGIERIQVQQIVQLQTEFGPNGEPVFSAVNDDRGLIKFVGSWTTVTDASGSRPSSTTATDFVEITFYGTALNMLAYLSANSNYTVAVDGNSSTAVSTSSTASTALGARNYAENTVLQVVSGLALGVHTVKITNTSAVINVYGFEVINTNSTTALNVNPGISYVGGNKNLLSIASSPAYNSTFDSGTLGTRGGHVVVYQKADGTIGKALTPTNAAQANLTSADHTNEEIIRSYGWREFGAGRSDDFSRTTGSGNTAAFTLDDGTTTLVASTVAVETLIPGEPEAITINAGTSNFMTLTFVGTGLDILAACDGTSRTVNVTVDGTSIGIIAPTLNKTQYYKIASGLPYGTHAIKFSNPTASFGTIDFIRFIVYQPKKPSIPTGAVELADYNVMANYVANTTAGLETIGTGLLRKQWSERESTLAGTWSVTSPSPVNYIGGIQADTTTTAGSTISYTFFGTGFEIRGAATTGLASSVSVTINNLAATTANFSTLASSVVGGYSFSAGTLSQAVSNTNGSGLSISGLPLALYTVKLTQNSSAIMVVEAFDIITPIYSAKSNLNYDQQNTLPVGSNALSDNRKTSPIATVSTKKNISQAVGISGTASTTSTSYVPCPDMSIVHTNTTGRIKISFTGLIYNGGFAGVGFRAFYVDGSAVYKDWGRDDNTAANSIFPVAATYVANVSPGTHKIDLYWLTQANTTYEYTNVRTLLVEEV